MKMKISCIVGTRPEIIKMVPVIRALQQTTWANTIIINSAQHRSLADPLFTLFKLKPHFDLDIMKPEQELTELTANLISRLGSTLMELEPDLVIAQGDTNTVFATALACFYSKIPFAHVEAGLRSYHLQNPFPEEANRQLIARLAALHFAPTQIAKINLLNEGISESNIHVTGNTIVDAILSLPNINMPPPVIISPKQRLILVTTHRRENLGQPLENICQALLTIVEQNPNVIIVFPIHANPKVINTVNMFLADHAQIIISPPFDYPEFISLLNASYLILTDSGGIQEEAAILGKPILILRNTTERREVLKRDFEQLVGTCPATIINAIQTVLDNPELYQKMAKASTAFGDGESANRIVNIIYRYLTNNS